MTNEEIRELIQLVTDTGVAELEVQRGEDRVRIRRAVATHEITLPAAPAHRQPSPWPCCKPRQPLPLQHRPAPTR